jgi:hypothetical protein
MILTQNYAGRDAEVIENHENVHNIGQGKA